jgi:ABC-type oligopeptide transport system ATPase subunit
MSAALSVTDVTKRFPAKRGVFGQVTEWFHAVDGVSFEHEQGTTLGIVGESGSGKTTLGKCIAGLLSPTEGSIQFEGRPITERLDIKTRLSVQMVHQATGAALDPRMKVGQIVAEGLHQMPGLARSEIRDRVGEALHAVGLSASDANRYPHMFSGGQRQRIVVARAMVLNPSLVILDEPTSALDVSIQVKVLNLLRRLQDELNLTYVLISHDIRAVQAMSSRIAVMHRGRIVELGPADKVLNTPVHPYTERLIGSVPMADPSQRIGEVGDQAAESDHAEAPSELVEVSEGHFVAGSEHGGGSSWSG